MINFIEIPLSKGLKAKISPEDYERVCMHRWHANQGCKKGTFYARAWINENGVKKHVLLHVFIMGNTEYDHADRDPLNCTRENLRVPPTRSHNRVNQPARSKTGYKGVYQYPQYKGKYLAQIGIPNSGGNLYLGLFDDAREAAIAVDKKAKEYWGEFAKLNFP